MVADHGELDLEVALLAGEGTVLDRGRDVTVDDVAAGLDCSKQGGRQAAAPVEPGHQLGQGPVHRRGAIQPGQLPVRPIAVADAQVLDAAVGPPDRLEHDAGIGGDVARASQDRCDGVVGRACGGRLRLRIRH